MDSIFQNRYLQNVNYSYKWFKRLQQAIKNSSNNVFPIEIWNQLFDFTIQCEEIPSMKELNLTSTERTAIILLGFECCGKSSYALEFIERFPNFHLVSVDSIILNIYFDSMRNKVLPSEASINNLTISKMGNILEKANKNLIIDGQFVYSNIRGALIKTLRQLGYTNIIMFNFLNAPTKYIEKRLNFRALEETMYKEYKKNCSTLELIYFKKIMLGKDPREKLLSIKPIEQWKKDEFYQNKYKKLHYNYFEKEPCQTGFYFQAKNNLFTSGIDKLVDVF